MEPSFNEIEKKLKARESGKLVSLNLRWAVAIAASIIVLFGLFTTFKSTTTTFEAPFAENKIVTLLDGSEVVLNANSLISFDEEKWQAKREVYLKGEAYFKVEKGSTFKVKTTNGEVIVLGTQFNVNSSEDFFEVSCFEGKVKVSSNGEETILVPTDVVRKINGFDTEHFNLEVNEPSWIHGESRFRSVPLKYVILALENQYQITFRKNNIDDSSIFTGSFSHKDLKTALASVFKSMNIQYEIKEDSVIALSYTK